MYALQLCNWVFEVPPKSIVASGQLNADGVDTGMQADLEFGNGLTASVVCSSAERLTNKATIIGTKGQITVTARAPHSETQQSAATWHSTITC